MGPTSRTSSDLNWPNGGAATIRSSANQAARGCGFSTCGIIARIANRADTRRNSRSYVVRDPLKRAAATRVQRVHSTLIAGESSPTHHQFAPTCAKNECTPTRREVSRSGNYVLFQLDSGQPPFGIGRRAAQSTTAPTSPRPIPNATSGASGSGAQPPGSEHFCTRLNPKNTIKGPIPRMVRPNGIAKRLEKGINMLAIPQLVKTKYTLLGPHPIG